MAETPKAEREARSRLKLSVFCCAVNDGDADAAPRRPNETAACRAMQTTGGAAATGEDGLAIGTMRPYEQHSLVFTMRSRNYRNRRYALHHRAPVRREPTVRFAYADRRILDAPLVCTGMPHTTTSPNPPGECAW